VGEIYMNYSIGMAAARQLTVGVTYTVIFE